MTDSSGEWDGECVRCGASDEWGVTLYDDHVGLTKTYPTEGIDLCADCRDKLEQWLNRTE